MLLRLSRACRCTSTSTALPCRHSAPVPSHTRSRPVSTTTAADSGSASGDRAHSASLLYPAPLWEQGWFHPQKSRSGSLQAWIANSRTTPAPAPPPPPPKPSPSPTSPTADPSAGRVLLAKYLSFRTPASKRNLLVSINKRHGARDLLVAAKDCGMPLVERLVLEDLQRLRAEDEPRWRLPVLRAVEVIGGEERQRNDPSWDRSTPPGIPDELELGRGFGEVVDTARGTSEPVAEASTPQWLDARRVMEDLLVGSTPGALPTHLVAALPNQTDAARLGELWKTFSAEVDPLASETDLALVLAFLLHLVAPPPPAAVSQSTTATLPLALKVLQSLLDSDESASLAAAPAVALPAAVKVQIVVLRTVAELATDAQLFPLAHRALLALAGLRATYKVARGDENDDLELLHHALAGVTDQLREARHVEFQPRATSPDHPLLIAHSLAIDLLPAWTPVLAHSRTGAPTVDDWTAALLARHTDECAARVRWDLVAHAWEKWGPQPRRRVKQARTTPTGWVLHAHHLKLLRWYAGEAPFSTYGVLASAVEGETRSVRPVDGAKVYDLALSTLRAFAYAYDPAQWRGWSAHDKSGLIELLTVSRGATQRTRSIARRFYAHFAAADPRAFVLPARGFLALIRTSCPPYADQRAFAAELVARRVATLTNPAGAYGPALDHFELTTLAQCYLELGDLPSLRGVYSRLLALRIVPDATDVQILVRAATRRLPSLARWYLKSLHAAGAPTDVALFEMVLRETVSQLADRPQQRDRAVARLAHLAETLDLTRADLDALALVHASLVGKAQYSKAHDAVFDNGEMRPTVVRSILREGIKAGKSRWVADVYDEASKAGFTDELYFRHVLAHLGPRPELRGHLERAIERALQREPPLITSSATYDSVLRSCIALDDWDSVGKIEQRLEPYGVLPTRKLVDTIQKWGERRANRNSAAEQ